MPVSIQRRLAALEVITRGGMAQIGPAVRFPIIDLTSIADELLEPICLASRSSDGKPKAVLYPYGMSDREQPFGRFKHAFDGADMKPSSPSKVGS